VRHETDQPRRSRGADEGGGGHGANLNPVKTLAQEIDGQQDAREAVGEGADTPRQ
jgi:hypothetical protein